MRKAYSELKAVQGAKDFKYGDALFVIIPEKRLKIGKAGVFQIWMKGNDEYEIFYTGSAEGFKKYFEKHFGKR